MRGGPEALTPGVSQIRAVVGRVGVDPQGEAPDDALTDPPLAVRQVAATAAPPAITARRLVMSRWARGRG
ncbi:hypothetical protein Shyhy02_49800 [Streptomyces hygroscopicus subsp. hygroscopicus]|nr:hypothetical protein Shyhy02_49800 [Streptomyces hygroscopicus subsp. hygroscopicus]